MSKNLVEPVDTNDVTVWRISVACSISKTTRVHTPTLPCTHTRTYARAHTHTHTHTHRAK